MVTVQRLAVNLTANDPFCVIHLGSHGEQLHKFKVVNSTESQVPEGNDEVTIESKHLTPFLFSAFGKTFGLGVLHECMNVFCVNSLVIYLRYPFAYILTS